MECQIGINQGAHTYVVRLQRVVMIDIPTQELPISIRSIDEEHSALAAKYVPTAVSCRS
jgi:hypothetical protein